MVNAPDKIIAGDSLAWTQELSSYPAGVWALTYYFASGNGDFKIEASADGTTHVVAVTPATTATYQPGRYRWHARVTSGAQVVTVADGWTSVKPNPASSLVDWRPHAQKMLEAIEAILEGSATKNQLDLVQYQVGATINVKRDRELLLKMRSQYANEAAAISGRSRHTYIRFARP